MTNTTLEQTNLTPAIQKAELILALSKDGLAYQQLLQESEDVVFTKENLNEERVALKNLREVKKKLEKMENPFTENWKKWNEARKSLVDPVVATLTKKEQEYSKLAREAAAEAKAIEDEKIRVDGIKKEIDDFFIAQSHAIAAAKTPQELVAIEKLIGSHKANSARYQEFLPDLALKASNLTPLIKNQKESIKKLTALNEQIEAAEATGDDQFILDAMEAKEQVEANISERKEVAQEKALSMAISGGSYATPVAPSVPKARLSKWTYEVVDIKQAEKAGLTQTIIDKEKVDALLREKRDLKEEGVFNGVRIFIDRKF